MKGQRGVRVTQVFCPKGKMVAIGQGYDVHTGDEVRFRGDFKYLYSIGLDIFHVRANGGGFMDLPVAAVERDQILGVACHPDRLPTLDEDVRPKYEPPPTPDDQAAGR